jgi:hypothetical protein
MGRLIVQLLTIAAGVSLVAISSAECSLTLDAWRETVACPPGWGGDWDWAAKEWGGGIDAMGAAKSGPPPYQAGGKWVATVGSDGAITGWTDVSTSSVPRSYAGTAIAANGYMYTIGGSPAPYDTFSSVEFAKINADGTLGDWTVTSSLVHTTGRAGAVAWGNHLFLIGGAQTHSGPWLDTVQVAEIASDGSLGPWTLESSVMKSGHPQNAAVVDNGWIYSISGGYHDYFTTDVERAQVLPDGTLGPWVLESSLPGVACHGASIVKDTIYVFGGYTGAYGSNLKNKVWAARINQDHSLEPWFEDWELPVSDDYSGVAVGDYLYALRGNDVQQTFYTEATPEPSILIVWSLLGTVAITVGWWRRRKAA